MKKTNVLIHWVGASKVAMISGLAVVALFFVSMQGISAQELTNVNSIDSKYAAPVFVGPAEAIESLNDGIALVDDHIENNPNMTDADIKHGRQLQEMARNMISDIETGKSVEESFTTRIHEFQVDHPNRNRDEQRKMMRVRKEMHDALTL